ncbi:MAG TPA: hypothetical protein VHO06_13435 [Polyangia bacterium]|nr:hypothetical protein [Polyangia bacterium]
MTAAAPRPRFVVCEDGDEYLARFRRFLGEAFDFLPARDFAEARAAAAGADGLLLDLDFRRTPPERLVDEQGPVPAPLDAGTRARLAETQGILILRGLRAAGVTLPAMLFADLTDAAQRDFLERTLAPLAVAGSRLGIAEIAARLRAGGLGIRADGRA